MVEPEEPLGICGKRGQERSLCALRDYTQESPTDVRITLATDGLAGPVCDDFK